jgi:peptidyl-prolyl cis-trans isomerase SurA
MRAAPSIPVLLAFLLAAAAVHPQTQPPPAVPPPAASGQPVELDHVVAIIGSNVILQSDVQQETRLSALEPLQVLPGQNTPGRALRRLIDRTLILQQMKEQQQPVSTPLPAVRKAIDDLRRQIPACTKFDCSSDQGWETFLASHDLSPDMVEQRWSQRIAMLRFIDLRFQSGIRIAPDQISAYYNKTLVPALEKDHETAPLLGEVTDRIREILLQQQVSGLFQDWLGSLHDQGNIQVVDPAYNADFDSKTTDEATQ